MGSTLSICGLGANDDNNIDTSGKPHARTLEREKMMELLSHTDRARSLSSTADTSVASILSNSDRLIPDAFLPVDIQVVSQRRVRPTSSRVLTNSNNAKVPHSSNHSHYHSNSAIANSTFLRYMMPPSTATTTTAASDATTTRKHPPRRGGGDSSSSSNNTSPERFDALLAHDTSVTGY